MDLENLNNTINQLELICRILHLRAEYAFILRAYGTVIVPGLPDYKLHKDRDSFLFIFVFSTQHRISKLI